MSQARVTPEQYLEIERKAEHKSEYRNGEIVAMAGVSRRHNRITLNIGSGLTTRLGDTSCEPYVNDLRVRVSQTKYLYPDVVAACGDPVFEDAELDTLLTPQVIVEVLSLSTVDKDRGTKFAFYRQVPMLLDYVMVSQEELLVEHYARQDNNHWLLSVLHGPDAVLRLSSIGCEMPLSEIYARVAFASAAEAEEGE